MVQLATKRRDFVVESYIRSDSEPAAKLTIQQQISPVGKSNVLTYLLGTRWSTYSPTI